MAFRHTPWDITTKKWTRHCRSTFRGSRIARNNRTDNAKPTTNIWYRYTPNNTFRRNGIYRHGCLILMEHLPLLSPDCFWNLRDFWMSEQSAINAFSICHEMRRIPFRVQKYNKKMTYANISAKKCTRRIICLWSELRSPRLLPFEAKSQLASPWQNWHRKKIEKQVTAQYSGYNPPAKNEHSAEPTPAFILYRAGRRFYPPRLDGYKETADDTR